MNLSARLLRVSMLLIAASVATPAFADESTLKEGAREVGRAVGTAAREVGEAGKKVGKAVAEVAKEGAQAVKEGAKEAKRAAKQPEK
jgi:hypothetical protein